MTRTLDLDDIQGNVTRAYGRFAFPFARYFFLNIADPDSGRRFVDLVRHEVTTAQRWTAESKPKCTLNIGFTFYGLLKLGLSSKTLQEMPQEFIEGMKNRAFVLGDRDTARTADDDTGWCDHWDPIWRNNRCGQIDTPQNVHIWISLNAQLKAEGTAEPDDALEEKTRRLREMCKTAGGVSILDGIGRNGEADYQAASAVFDKIGGIPVPTPKEHFGFTDGISDPVFEGQYPDDEMADKVIGRGKRMNGEWQPIATGEFILGHPDESQELPPTPRPVEFMHNGTFMAFRKLHENVATFDAVVKEEAERYARVMGLDDMDEAVETIRAKMCGRWSDGVPLAKVPTYAEWRSFRRDNHFEDKNPLVALKAQVDYIRSRHASDFRYADDMPGFKCPGGAHVRRVNTRDYLDPLNTGGVDAAGNPHPNDKATSQLNKRRRILRRGLPYGPHNFEHKDDDTEQGVAMMMIGASLFRQFEFVQQQWIQYGLDFHQGNNTCPMLGDHTHHTRFTIPADPRSGKPPYVMSKLKTFVECRGGDYFFIPSLTGLRMIAMGIVDPT